MSVYTVGYLASLVGGEVVGNPEIAISGVADLASAQVGDISFLGNPRYTSLAFQTKASALVVDRHGPSCFPCTQIRVDSPSLAFSQIAALFLPAPARPEAGVHPLAFVAQDVELGQDVSVGPYAIVEKGVRIGPRTIVGAGSYIGPECQIGADCFLYPHVVIRERCVLGNRVTLHPGVVIGSDGFGYELIEGKHRKIPQLGSVQIDDDVEIGANTTVDRGRFGKTWIQEGCKIDNLVQIGHNVVIGKHCVIVAQTGISGSTTLGSYVTLAGQVGLAGHLHIGERAIITAQSGVAKDVPPGAIYSGSHARPAAETLRLEALYRKLPQLWKRVQQLEQRLEELESGCSPTGMPHPERSS
ncbi:UDP-3-O-(3-hydroxymyristoyl)glucosamine N-acyltransferase [Candidatus Methylacidithermus pantelleriae]|uniref:UDP-3-O-acylglucosamine N-acyltransferase n=1 Tax=Candidatus Methylacidithermus pantelleriae TaxID=2744239 RepID=A0A8J2FRX4_9BACT|nr:UDP-3-O-(3-hydroxymyristoyl)glucosamine N-acyltransferase [Candidatus Methylacidithermus pantelleriae]CAF0691858.1 UDP-3-O-acylglucosamine N-acyltransferase [Candidatus Methylacidithermus pantelleriae]